MASFLFRIAQVFYKEYQSDIRKFTFVFPNRRAGIFFQQYLSELTDKPLFSPDIITINDCFYRSTNSQLIDRTDALFRLYRIYNEITKNKETFDSFFHWGEMLLADFNDVDKYRVNASKIFSNVKGLKEIDTISESLNEEQRKAIYQFWNHFIPETTQKTEVDFIEAWRVLFPLYEAFEKELESNGLATEGMILRKVSDDLLNDYLSDFLKEKQFVFIGFNALNPCEQILFRELRNRKQADFYWDYEAEEVRDEFNEASHFYKENVHNFPSKFKIESETQPLNDKTIDLIAVPSEVGQAKEVYRLLDELYPENASDNDWIKTAIVLSNESLLIPMLHSLPEKIEKINVTMGYPLKSTPVAGLLNQIFELQLKKDVEGKFYYQTVFNLLNHSYISKLDVEGIDQIKSQIIDSNLVYVDSKLFEENVFLKILFTPQKDSYEFVDYLLRVIRELNVAWQKAAEENNSFRLENDFLYQCYLTINRLKDVMRNFKGEIEMNLNTVIRIVNQLVNGISIPFEGEPLNGLQIMGMLETRGLDFENLIICSFNEGVFPKREFSNSFIPYNLRRAFGLPTVDFQDSVTDYNFYRLIHRTKRIFLLYNSNTSDMQTGEPSRYVYQLMYHYGVDLKKKELSFELALSNENPIQVIKTDDVMRKLYLFQAEGEDARYISPSSLTTYVACPLQFYFSYVEQLREPDEVMELIEPNMFGTLLHAVMESIYKPYEGKTIEKVDLENLIKERELIRQTIHEAFRVNYFKNKIHENEFELDGNNLLMANIIERYVKKILEWDASYTPFKYIKSEQNLKMKFPVFDGKFHINLKGKIDRIDEKDVVTRVVDYKTGEKKSMDIKSMGNLFAHDSKESMSFLIQTFIYCLLYLDKNDLSQILPTVYVVREMSDSNYSGQFTDKMESKNGKPVDNFLDYKEQFTEQLTACLEELFNPDVPFTQTQEIENCKYCSFKAICRR